MKTKNLTLKAYSALGIALLSQSNSEAQVVIKDFDPDLRMMNWREDTLTRDTVSIDIDENGIDDLIFTYEAEIAWGWGIIKVDALFDDAVTGFFARSSGWLPYDFQTGDTINNSLYLYPNTISLHIADVSNFLYGGVEISYWGGFRIDEYLAFNIVIESENHLGWVRLSSKTIGDQDLTEFYHTGSPLTIYELAYNETPIESIICNAGVLQELGSISSVSLIDDIDANDITDLGFKFSAADSLDFFELRFFLIPSREDVISFSVAEALAIDENRFLRISADSVILGEHNTFQFPPSLLDINGNEFSSDTYYSGFYMKIPIEGDTSNLTLSAPLNVIKPELQRCELDINDIYAIDDDDDNYIDLSFTADAYDDDISEYAFGLILEQDFEDWFYYGPDPGYFDLDWVIHIPETEESVYDTLINAPSKDIYGEEIIPDYTYYPILIGFGDGYYRDLFCYEVGAGDILLSAEEIYKNTFHIWQANTEGLNVMISENNSEKYTLEVTNIAGELITIKNIISDKQTFSFPELPDGVYIATIKENGIPVLVSKVILQK